VGLKIMEAVFTAEDKANLEALTEKYLDLN